MQKDYIQIVPKEVRHADDGTQAFVMFQGSRILSIGKTKFNETAEKGKVEYLEMGELLTSEPKLLIEFNTEFYHFIFETLARVDSYVKAKGGDYKDLTIIIPPYRTVRPPRPFDDSMEKVFNFYVEELTVRGATCIHIPEAKNWNIPLVVPIKNFYTFKDDSISLYDVKLSRDFLLESLRREELTAPNPGRSIYLSRQSTVDTLDVRPLDIVELKRNLHVDFPARYPRIFKESDFASYLTNELKMTLVEPEYISTFKEQLQVFTNAEVLMSVTSSGLANMLVMPEGSTVVELRTPLIVSLRDDEQDVSLYQSYHDMYSYIATACGLSYVSIDNSKRSSVRMQDYINSKPWLQKLLNRSLD